MSNIHVAVAVIISSEQEVLVSLRQAHQHQGGLWEFPGGKVEQGEAVYDALLREINEEVGLLITAAQPLIEIEHDYGDKSVLLDVWTVTSFEGIAEGREGQKLRWTAIGELNENDFPSANIEIIKMLKTKSKP
ncbi:MAG: 8-oxo-dGTP diphosphatase MutT [Gammaproteobacteria bacterium]|nr:MAG: 8-oxo-dGTP diphosphatase MutT [Gammaproteobacteria bacterium]